jgi:hypothetical protein
VGLLPPPPDDEDRRRAGDDGSRDAAPVTGAVQPDDPRLAGVVVPDDLRGLEAEILAVQAELGVVVPAPSPLGRWDRWRARLRLTSRRNRSSRHGLAPVDGSWPPPGGLARSLLVGPVLAFVLLSVAALVALLPASSRGTAPESTRVPALAAPTQAVGTVGGLLPDLTLGGAAGPVPVRSLRPAVLLLVPDRCDCPALVHQVMGQVEEFPGVSAAIIGSGSADLAQLAVARDGGNGRLPVLVDGAGSLARTYHGGPAGTVPTLLFVAPNGRLTSPPLAFIPGSRIEAQLLPLVLARA